MTRNRRIPTERELLEKGVRLYRSLMATGLVLLSAGIVLAWLEARVRGLGGCLALLGLGVLGCSTAGLVRQLSDLKNPLTEKLDEALQRHAESGERR